MILQAVFRIRDTTLVVEVNSAKRVDRAKKEIEKRLGAGAVHLGTEITSTEGAARKASALTTEEAARHAGEQERLMALPEVQTMMKAQMEKHLKSWSDTPIPALNNMTPREAAADPIGRELLESLLLNFESKNRHLRYPFQRVDIGRLRRETGMV